MENLAKDRAAVRVELQNAKDLAAIRAGIEKIRAIEKAALKGVALVEVFVTPERGFYIRANGLEYGADTEALARLAPRGMKGAPYIRVGGSYGRSFRLDAGQVNLQELRHMLENYEGWNQRDIAARNRLQMYG